MCVNDQLQPNLSLKEQRHIVKLKAAGKMLVSILKHDVLIYCPCPQLQNFIFEITLSSLT